MKRSMLRAVLLGGVLLGAFGLPAIAFEAGLPLAQAPAEQVGMSAKKLERIREALKGEIDQDKLPGTVVMPSLRLSDEGVERSPAIAMRCSLPSRPNALSFLPRSISARAVR